MAGQGWVRTVFAAHGAASSSDHLSRAAWPPYRPLSEERGYGPLLIAWPGHRRASRERAHPPDSRSPLECAHFLLGISCYRSDRHRGRRSYLGVLASPVRVDLELLDEGPILPYLTVVLTNAQVLPTDGANCKDRFRALSKD